MSNMSNMSKHSRSRLLESRALWALAPVFTAALVVACGGGGSGSNADAGSNNSGSDSTSVLTAQSGQASYLFYGNTDHQKLGATTSAKVFAATDSATTLTSSDIMLASQGRAQPSTVVSGYSSSDGSYTDLYLDKLYYVNTAGAPKVATLKITHDDSTHTDSQPTETAHSNATGLTNPSYTEINYLGTKRFLIATNAASKKVLVFPSATNENEPIDFTNKTLLTVFYTAFGDKASGVVVYDSATFKFQKMVPSTLGCSACGEDPTETKYTNFTGGPTLTAAPTYKFLGDIGGTARSAVIINGKLYLLNKADLTITEVPVTASDATVSTTISATETGFTLKGSVAYFLRKDTTGKVTTLYGLNVTTGKLVHMTKDHGGAKAQQPGKFLAFTTDHVFYGTDGLTLAVKKNAEEASPTLLAENTQTSGIRYPFNFGIGGDYLYQTYKVNTTTGVTSYQACVYSAAGVNSCRDNSFWAAVTAARKGKLDFESNYLYTPYAYVRVDNTDNYGGGDLKAVLPSAPLADGTKLGTVKDYNFYSFLQGYYYLNTMVDTSGKIVLYGKRDDNFIGDAFLLDLVKPSVKQVTSESAPTVTKLNTGDLHCHGRYCQICHAFAGGKIYDDAAGTSATGGHNIRLKFSDGSSTTARLGKGLGENFSTLYSEIVKGGTFTPAVVKASDGSEVKSATLEHTGLSYSNCNLCHSPSGIAAGRATKLISSAAN